MGIAKHTLGPAEQDIRYYVKKNSLPRSVSKHFSKSHYLNYHLESPMLNLRSPTPTRTSGRTDPRGGPHAHLIYLFPLLTSALSRGLSVPLPLLSLLLFPFHLFESSALSSSIRIHRSLSARGTTEDRARAFLCRWKVAAPD